MGCLNPGSGFKHWFGNIHLSGPCNRACYFCIGQHMMALDPLNVLKTHPLPNLDWFIEQCKVQDVNEINITGSNTDPLLYHYLPELKAKLKEEIPDLYFGLRTNAVDALKKPELVDLFDKFSISVCSLDPELYKVTMGKGEVPDLAAIRKRWPKTPIKINVILCPETVNSGDLWRTLDGLAEMGYTKVNLREPYGQAHIGDPMQQAGYEPYKHFLGMPNYHYKGMRVCYWDVHYVEVESVNLYANGHVSVLYPVTSGHDPVVGKVEDQSNFSSGRHNEQWQYKQYGGCKKAA